MDTADLSRIESTLPQAERRRKLAPHDRASRRVFVSPEEFSAGDYETISSCLLRHMEKINRGFATPRPPVEYFKGVDRQSHAVVRSPDLRPRCAPGALSNWLGEDRMRFLRDCRLPSGRRKPQSTSKSPAVIVWFPLASIANTSKPCVPGPSVSSSSSGSLMLVLVDGRVI